MLLDLLLLLLLLLRVIHHGPLLLSLLLLEHRRRGSVGRRPPDRNRLSGHHRSDPRPDGRRVSLLLLITSHAHAHVLTHHHVGLVGHSSSRRGNSTRHHWRFIIWRWRARHSLLLLMLLLMLLLLLLLLHHLHPHHGGLDCSIQLVVGWEENQNKNNKELAIEKIGDSNINVQPVVAVVAASPAVVVGPLAAGR